MKFTYLGYDRGGQQVQDTVEASTLAEARENLRKQGIYVTQIQQEAAEAAGGRRWSLPPSRNRRLRQIAGFTRQLHVLIFSGTQLMQALQALERQAGDADWRAVIADLRTRVEEGSSLSAAMAHHPGYFDAVCRSLVTAGEASGKLEPMLDRLAKLTRKQIQVRSAIRGAMVYPCLLIFVSISVLIVLLTFVLPRFAGMFETLDAPLPPTTKIVMAASDLLLSYWWAGLIAIVGAVVGVLMWLKTDAGRAVFDATVLKLPVFGAILKNFATARIARLLGVQLEGRVPLLEALQLTKQAAGNVVFAKVVERAEEAATRGQSVSNIFAESKLMPPTICEAIRSGEATGQMALLLTNIADFLDDENEITIRSLTSILEPMILIVMGICVGFVAISMFLPMFDLAGMAGQGGGG